MNRRNVAVGLGIAALGVAALTMDADFNKDGDAPAETAREVAALAASAQVTVDGGVPMEAPAVASTPNSWTVPKGELPALGGSQDLKVYGTATLATCFVTAESIRAVLSFLPLNDDSLPISKISITPAAPHRPAAPPGLQLPASPGGDPPPCEQIMHVTRGANKHSEAVPVVDGTGEVLMTIDVDDLPPREKRKFGTFL